MLDPQPIRRLIVMRHAKAGDLPGGPDSERALTPRGQADATRAGQWLARHGYEPGTVLSSTARRARQTWQHVAAELTSEPQRAIEDHSLYEATAGDVLEIIRRAGDQAATLMYVGHNPAAGNLSAVLTAIPAPFPTAAVAVIEFSGAWADLDPGAGARIASWAPNR